ncbi:MAG: sigma 54-interacting transcriptional regulator [Xanthomonadales bacterium]|nr:sigma 54-interacting transcriptional regulator [Xanthomonadales bacterium]
MAEPVQLQLTIRGLNGDRRHRLGVGRHQLGTHQDCDVALQDPTVSRRHLQLEFDGERIWLQDLGSLNGTWVDGRRIDRMELSAEQTEIRLGEVPVRIEALGGAEVRLAVAGDAATGESVVPSIQPPAATWAQGGVARFSLRHLPGLLDRLRGQVDPVAYAQALLGALHEGGNDLAYSVLHDRAVMASVGQTSGSSGRHWRQSAWSLQVVGEEAELQQQAPLLEIASRLLALLDPPAEADTAATRGPRRDVGLPSPQTQNAELAGLYAQAKVVADSQIGVLIRGETGTGKELFARYLHAQAGDERPWIALNCAALPEDLLEAELFGIDKGIATGVSERAGCFEQADGGTLFLDEVGDMAASTQAKILRVLQEKQVLRVGSQRARPARVRLIAATHCDLDAMVESGQFRRDLYHRLADWTVELPALRQRREDVANLAAHFLSAEMRRLGKRFGGLSEAAVARLQGYGWPGNVRELEREMLRCALFLQSGEALLTGHLQPRFRQPSLPDETADDSLKGQLLQAERKIISTALAQCDGDVKVAAERLDCGSSTLYRRIDLLGLRMR